MDIYDRIIDFFQNSEEETEEKAPEGLCAVCWGYQKYDKKIRIILEDKQIDVNNHSRKYMQIQKLLKNEIEGIKLKKGEIQDCPTCSDKSNQ